MKHIVVKGDTLYSIATKYNTTVDQLVKLNNIVNPNMLAIGQEIEFGDDGSSGGSGGNSGSNTSKPESGNKAKILQFGLLSTSDNTLFATWSWEKNNTKSYQVKWEYTVTDWPDTWIVDSSSSIAVDHNDPSASRQSRWNILSGASAVRFTVKPISESKDSSGDSVYWTADWSTRKIHYVSDNPPSVPPVPTIELTDNLVVAKLENLNVNATVVQFQVLKRNATRFEQFKISNTTIQYIDDTDRNNRENGYARYSCRVDDNGEYKVRARSARDGLYSDWSDYSSSVFSLPAAPESITTIRASSKSSVYLEWTAVDTAETYDIQYATEITKLEGSEESVTKTGVTTAYYDISGLENGDEYFFRVRAVRNGTASKWTEPVSVIVGKKPSMPTTWASSTTVVTGEPLVLYWVHNSEDNSSQVEAELEMNIGGMIETFTIANDRPEDEKDKVSSYEVDTSALSYGSTILWRVRTRGVLPEFSDWSTERTVEIYARPVLTLEVTNAQGVAFETLSAFPLNIEATAGPVSQQPVGYHLSIVANESYETVDNAGNFKMVTKGEEVFSRHYDISTPLSIRLSAGDVTLDNNVSYALTCTVTMNSGLTTNASITFTTGWSDDAYWPNAEISIDTTSYTATILPYCRDSSGALVENLTLAVYRRNFDGSFTEILSGIDNNGATHITDPHPALDYARYRIVATSTVTGVVSYYDMPGVKVGGNAIIMQWDEAWSNFDTPDVNVPVEPYWTGSVLKLPYNIDIREDAKPDVSHIEYIGREHPVTYHGTQLGESAAWSTVIDKRDVETLYALRRLARWRGNVYVREPSGSGYWATVTVSIDQKHREPAVPVAINITRVEGGV